MQSTLSKQQLQAFYHDDFVEDQTRHFVALVGAAGDQRRLVVDVGGGCGFFARRLAELIGATVKVIDTDPASVAACRQLGIDARIGNALDPPEEKDCTVTLNLVLHHLIGASEKATLDLQRRALTVWRSRANEIFVNEYIYESFLGNFSGWLIYQITKSRILSWLGRSIAKLVPAFRANTFGIGVRFRSHAEWVEVFASAGYEVKSSMLGWEERVSVPLRLLLIKNIRRDSFLLVPAGTQAV
jgi:SAM-dependent methyltransferase